MSVVALTLDTNGRIVEQALSTDVTTATNNTGSTIAANKAVTLFNNSGTLEMRLANSSGTYDDRPVYGFTTGSVANGAAGAVATAGELGGFSSLTPAAFYWSDPATPGSITSSCPTSSGEKAQKIGWAISATNLLIRIFEPIKRA